MSDVKRYLADDQYPGQYSARCDLVPAKAYDALREELAISNKVGKAIGETLGRVTFERDDLHKRLTAAEQRNAELVELLQTKIDAFETLGDEYGKLYRSWKAANNLLERAYGAIDDFSLCEEIKIAIHNPTESGASENSPLTVVSFNPAAGTAVMSDGTTMSSPDNINWTPKP